MKVSEIEQDLFNMHGIKTDAMAKKIQKEIDRDIFKSINRAIETDKKQQKIQEMEQLKREVEQSLGIK